MEPIESFAHKIDFFQTNSGKIGFKKRDLDYFTHGYVGLFTNSKFCRIPVHTEL